MCVDLRRGNDVMLRLVDGADVLVQSLRPGLAEERGLGAEALRARNPRLVYCSIRSFGRTGPWRDRPGYDPLAQAAGGIVSVTGEPGRDGVRAGVSVSDQGTGMWAAIGILAALHERERTGEGREVDVSLYETALGFMAYHLTGFLGAGAVPAPHGTAFPSIVPYQAFSASDGRLMIAAGNDRLFAALVERARPAGAGVGRALHDQRRSRGEPRGARSAARGAASPPSRGRTGSRASRTRASRRRRFRTCPRSPRRSRPRRSRSCRSFHTPPSAACAFLRSRSRSTVSVSVTTRRRPSSAPTPPRCWRRPGYSEPEIAELVAAGIVALARD